MEFLEYLRSWKESTKNRPGNFSQNARAHMFLSWQTYKGFQLTFQSTIESTKFLRRPKRVWSMFWRNDSVRILQKSYLVSSDSLVDEVTTQTQVSLGTITTLRIERSISCQKETLEAGRTRREHGCRLQMRSCRVKKSSNFNVTVACNCLVGFMYIYTCISLSEDKCNCMECCQNIQKLNNKEVCLRILTWQELFQNILQFHRSRFWVYRQWSIFQFLSLRLYSWG